MQSRTHDIDSVQDTTSSEVIECKLMNCPNCKQEVPETIYCLRCGYPIYAMKQLEKERANISSEEAPLESEPDLEEPQIEEPQVTEDNIEPLDESNIVEEVLPEIHFEIEYPPVEIEKLPQPVEPELLSAPSEPVLLPEISLEVHDEIIVIEKPVTEQDVEILVDINPDIEDEPLEDSPIQPQVSFNEPITNETVVEESEEMHEEYMPEPVTQELLKDLMNSISLKLWAIDLLTKERAKEDHFLNLFEGYKSRYEHCMTQRNKMLEKAQDLGPLEKELDTARVGIGELEIRKSLGDLRKGEYEAKAPAYSWDIQYYEKELAKRNGEISFLENPAKLLPSEEVVKLKELAQRNYESLSQLEAENKISVSTAEMVRNDLQKDLGFLKGLEGY